jgi:hypothetical protein
LSTTINTQELELVLKVDSVLVDVDVFCRPISERACEIHPIKSEDQEAEEEEDREVNSGCG